MNAQRSCNRVLMGSSRLWAYLLVLAYAAPASAQPKAAPASAQPKAAPTPPSDNSKSARRVDADELLAEFLSREADADIQWLYDDAIYQSSKLGGTPLAARGLPSRGEGSTRTWDPRWTRFGPINYLLASAGVAANLGGHLITPRATPWRGINAFDESVRNSISINNYNRGVWARDASDIGLSTTLIFPFLVDSLIVMAWYRESPDVATEMALISVEAIGVAAALQGLTAGLASRERPYVRNCENQLDADLQACNGRNRFRSFFSGHTSQSFAAASVTCTLHMKHAVFGDPVADGIACGGALATAAGVGTMRIVGNQHYATDVLVGASIGLLAGLGVPWLLHYRTTDSGERAQVQLSIQGSALGLKGTF